MTGQFGIADLLEWLNNISDAYNSVVIERFNLKPKRLGPSLQFEQVSKLKKAMMFQE